MLWESGLLYLRLYILEEAWVYKLAQRADMAFDEMCHVVNKRIMGYSWIPTGEKLLWSGQLKIGQNWK